ncbi:MAG: hypothetical protein PHU51_01490 [Candidatus Nanoarchaeia archaeon]|nr:hypothetical protein [Candidatus Nanoarchaeia archaeon]
MGELKENPNANRDLIIAVIVLFGLWGYKHFEENPIDWWAIAHVGIVFLLSVILLIGIIIAIISIYRHKKQKKEEFEKITREFHDVVKYSPSTLEECAKKLQKLEEYKETFPIEVNKTKSNVDIRIKEIKEKIKQDKKREIYWAEQRRKEILEEKQLEKIYEEQVSRLLNHFIEKGSNESIPEWALEFDKDVIEDARKEYRIFKQEEKNKKTQWNEISKFVLSTDGFPHDFQDKDEDEQELYYKAMELKKQGKLKIQEEDVYGEINKELLEKKFYFYNELSIKDRDLLTTKCGYRHKSFMFLDGRSGNKVLIKNDNPSESDNHFCKKHLIASIDNSMSKIEYEINNQRADVMFSVIGLKIAVEIETGTNKDIQIQRKVDWLNKHFDYWIIICPRKEKTKYKKFVDGKKSYCHTLKEGVEFIQSILNPS